MATIEDLGKKVKAKYPGQYDDLGDADLGKMVKGKYPGQYDDFADMVPSAAPVNEVVEKAQNIPVSVMTGDPATDKRIAQIAYDRGMKRPYTLKDAAGSAAVGAGLIGSAIPGVGMGGSMLSGSLLSGGLAAGDEGATPASVAVSGGAGAVLPAAIHGVAKVAARALPRAYRMALKVLRPSPDETMELEKRMVDWESAGKLVDEAGAAKPGMDLRERRAVLDALAKEGGEGMEAARTAAETKGASVDPATLRAKLVAEVDKQFPPGSTLTASQAQAKAAALKHIDDLTLHPELQGGAGSLEAFENAKRSVGVEGFLKGGKYARSDVAAKDPEATFFRRAYKAYKEAPEEAIRRVDADLADEYVAARGKADVGQTFGPIAQRSSNVEFAGGALGGIPDRAWGGRSALFHSFYDPIMNRARPVLIPVNKALQKAYNVAPKGAAQMSSSTINAAIIDYLRSKEDD